MESVVPIPPKTISASSILERMIDSIAVRFELATRDLTEENLLFRPVESSMSIGEVTNHIHSLLSYVLKSIDKENKYQKPETTVNGLRESILALCTSLKAQFHNSSNEDLEKINLYLKRVDRNYSFWYMINGPLADVLTHIGQINSWRRMDGNPCPKISPFTGEPY